MPRLLLVCVAFCLLGASPAWAGGVQVTPIIKGSGSISLQNSTEFCSQTGTNDAVVQCAAFAYPTGIVIEAKPPAEGDWQFQNWGGSCAGTAPTCSLPATMLPTQPYTAVAFFADNKAPVFTALTATPSSTVDRQVTLGW